MVQFVRTVMSVLRVVEKEIENIRSDQRRAEFYANRVLCALVGEVGEGECSSIRPALE